MKRRDLLKLGAAVSAGAATDLVPSALHGAAPGPGRHLRARNIIFFAYDGLGNRSSDCRSGAGPVPRRDTAHDDPGAGSGPGNGDGTRHVDPDHPRHSGRLGRAPLGPQCGRGDRGPASQRRRRRPSGRGRAAFEAERRSDGRDLFAEFEARGYSVLRTPEDLAGSNGSRLLGVFTEGDEHLPYEVDRRFREVPAPSLADVAGKALEVLDGAENEFVLQIEAGRIDHANHQNDPGGMIWDWMAAEGALALAMEHVDRNPDTFLIAVPDHDCGGGVTYGIGPWYLRSTESLATLHRRRTSHEWLLRNVLAEETDPRAVADAVREFLGVPLAQPRAEAVVHLLEGEGPETWPWGHPNAHGSEATAFGHPVSITDEPSAVDRPNINFSTGAHTGGLVPVVLHGAGAGQGNLGVISCSG